MPDKDLFPITTPTVAKLCLAQGKLEQAEAIYLHLLQEDPADPELLGGLAEIRRQRETLSAPEATDRVAIDSEGQSLVCRWVVSESGQRRAQLILGSPGSLVLRLVSFPATAEIPPEDIALVALSGTVERPRPAAAHVLAAAVGLRDESGRFVSIAHATLVPRLVSS